MALQAMLAGALARFQRADSVQRPHAHPPSPAVQHEAEHPVLGAVGGDAQVKPSTIAVHAGLFCLVHLERRELAYGSRHDTLTVSNKSVHKYSADYDEGQRTCPEGKISQLQPKYRRFLNCSERQRRKAKDAFGGRGGIRTHEGLPPLAVFKTAALNHSATLPSLENSTKFHLAFGGADANGHQMVTNIMALIRILYQLTSTERGVV